MAISTYAELKTAIQNWAKRSDILSVIDDFIDLAEADIWENLRIRDMEASDSSSVSSRTVALPSDYLQARKLDLVKGNLRYPQYYAAPESLKISETSGIPANYTITSQIEFDRPPSGTYTMDFKYYKSLTPLSNSNTSNAVLTRFPSVYLYGSLFHFAQWAHNDAMLQKYSVLFDDAVKRANKSDRRGRYGAAPAMRIEGSTP